MSDKMEAIVSGLIAQGIPAYGEIHAVAASNTSAVGNYMLQYLAPDRWHNKIAVAEARMATGRNDTLLVTPESHSLTASLTWDLNNSNMVGMAPASRMNIRARVGMSTTFTPMLTVSGYGNTFADLYFMHGTAGTDLIGASITGARNFFKNVHFAGPLVAAQAAADTFNLVKIASAENYFKDCHFGVDSATMAAGCLIKLAAGGDNSQRVIFENCIFSMNASANAAFFLSGTAGLGEACAIFKGCTFINSGTALTFGIDGTGLNNYIMYFDQGCSFVGCTDIVAAAQEATVWCGSVNLTYTQATTSASATYNMIATHPDVSVS